jgi:UDP-N-acetylglucosamine transferase subunit ALG13
VSVPRTADDEPIRSVFVTVGTDHHPFDRLIRWIDEWLNGASADCFVQFGTSQAPSMCPGSAYLSHEETRQRIADADAIVCHGGPGTIIDCLSSGTMPIVVPRRHDDGEHVDDHQVRFTARLEESAYIKVAQTSVELGDLLEAALQGSADVLSPTNRAMLQESVDRFAALVAPLLPPEG